MKSVNFQTGDSVHFRDGVDNYTFAVAGFAGLAIPNFLLALILMLLFQSVFGMARAKGVPESTLLFKYPVKIAINPIIRTIGWTLPGIVSGETITAIVLSLPTTGPLLYRA